MWQLLDNPLIWELSRVSLDLAFGLYRKRIQVMKSWNVLQDSPSVLDIGCGIGQYAKITNSKYLGVDLNKAYLNYACKRHQQPHHSFKYISVSDLVETHKQSFDLVLMVDLLHHLSEEQCVLLLSTAKRLAKKHILSFEPVTFQPSPIGQWIVEHDRGSHVRSLERLHQLFKDAQLGITKSIELPLGPINTRAILCQP